jgi:hypothetical protein
MEMNLKPIISIDYFGGKANQKNLFDGIQDKAIVTHSIHNY